MQNPYAASSLSTESAAEGRQRRPVWKSLLIAYSVHHGCVVAGFVLGAMVFDPHGLSSVFPPSEPLTWLMQVTLGPPMIDWYVVLEPFLIGVLTPFTFIWLRWARMIVTITVVFAGIAYGLRPRSVLLGYLAIISFLIGFTVVFTVASDR